MARGLSKPLHFGKVHTTGAKGGGMGSGYCCPADQGPLLKMLLLECFSLYICQIHCSDNSLSTGEKAR
jgi:hypothetical protein